MRYRKKAEVGRHPGPHAAQAGAVVEAVPTAEGLTQEGWSREELGEVAVAGVAELSQRQFQHRGAVEEAQPRAEWDAAAAAAAQAGAVAVAAGPRVLRPPGDAGGER